MNQKTRKILLAIYADPLNGNLAWRDVEALFVSIGCKRIEGAGSSVTFERNGLRATFHRPHPQKEALRYRIKDARRFLELLGVRP